MNRITIWIMLVLIFAQAGCYHLSGDSDPHERIPNISGEWQSIEFGGSDIGNSINQVFYIFETDGTFRVTVSIENREESYSGTYKLDGKELELVVQGRKTHKLPYALSGDLLTIKDSTLDSWIRFKKKSNKTEQRPNKVL